MYGKDIADTIKDLEKLKPGAMGNPDFSVTNRPGNQTVVNYIKNLMVLILKHYYMKVYIKLLLHKWN